MTYGSFQQTAQGFSRGMTIVGSIILMVCVGLLTITWWRDGRWLWVAIGIGIIVVNIALIFLQFRKAKLQPRPADSADGAPKKRRGIIDPLDDLDD